MMRTLLAAILVSSACVGDGSGNDNPPAVPYVTNGGNSMDFNNDGYADIVVRSGGTKICYGSPSGPPETCEDNEVNASEVRFVGDVDGDGYADLSGSRGILFGGPDGLANSVVPLQVIAEDARANYGVFTFAGDVDGDGYDDMIQGNDTLGGQGINKPEPNPAAIVFGSGDRMFTRRQTLNENQSQWYILGDLDGDGRDDLAGVAFDRPNAVCGDIGWYFGTAAGVPELPTTTMGYQNWGCPMEMAGDLNGDGIADVLANSDAPVNNPGGEGLVACAGSLHGGASLPAAPNQHVCEFNRTNVSILGHLFPAGDVNGDGFMDLVTAQRTGFDRTGRVELYLGSSQGLGNSTVEFEMLELYESATWAVSLMTGSVGDVNGDGFADFAFTSNFANPIVIHYGSSNGLSARADVVVYPQRMGANVALFSRFIRP